MKRRCQGRRSTPNEADVQRGIESICRRIAERLECDLATLRLDRDGWWQEVDGECRKVDWTIYCIDALHRAS